MEDACIYVLCIMLYVLGNSLSDGKSFRQDTRGDRVFFT